jgi:hypothetical protein
VLRNERTTVERDNGVDEREFVLRLMFHYDPLTHGILFGQPPRHKVAAASTRSPARSSTLTR